MDMERLAAVCVLILIVSAAAVLSLSALIRRRKRQAFVPMDDLEGHDFEYYCADLLRSDGFTDVKVTKGSGDYGADILAEKDGVTYAVQCKIYSSPVGVLAVQEAAAGRDYYERMVGAVMTNQYFTRNAVTAARKLRVLLWDREHLSELQEKRY